MAPIELFAPGALVFVVLTALAVVSSSFYSWWVQRYDGERAVAKLDRAATVGKVYSILGVSIALDWSGTPVAVRQSVASISTFSAASFPVTLTAVAVFVVLVAVNAAMWYLPLALAKVVALDADETVDELLGRATLTVLFASAMMFCPLVVAQSPTLGLFDYPAALTAAGALYLLFSMEYYLLSQPRWPPSAAERERLEAAFAALELDPRRIRILSMDADEVIDIGYLGLVNPEMVVIPERVLSVVDDERLRVLVTGLDSISRTPFVAGRTAVLVGSALAAVWLLSPLAPASDGVRLLLLTGVCLVAAASLWRFRMYVYRADSATADRIGARTLLEHYEWWLEFSGEDRTHSRIRTVLFSHPPLAQRMSRLRERVDDEVPTTTDDPNPAD